MTQTELTSALDFKQNTLEGPYLENLDLSKGCILCTSITTASLSTGTLSALLTISALQSITAGTQLTVGTIDVGAKLISLDSRVSSNESGISSNASSISGVAASVSTLEASVFGIGIWPFKTPGLSDLVVTNTASIVGLSASLGTANGKKDDNEDDISSLKSGKQNNINNETDITCRDITCDNIILNSPDIDGINIAKGSLTATTTILKVE